MNHVTIKMVMLTLVVHCSFTGMTAGMLLEPEEVAELLPGYLDGYTLVALVSWQMLVQDASLGIDMWRYWRRSCFHLCKPYSTLT